MRLRPANGLNRAFWVFASAAALSWVAAVVIYAIAVAGRPVDSPVVLVVGAVFVISLTGATVIGFFAERHDGGLSLRGIEGMQDSFALTPRQARRMSRQFAQAGVRISPSRLRAISAGAEASDSELVDIDFALIATEPGHQELLRPRSPKRSR